MENEDRPFTRFVASCRVWYEEYVRFVWGFHGVAAAAEAPDLAYRTARDTLEKAP